eukprot:1364910-Prymnesium_polylepis.1
MDHVDCPRKLWPRIGNAESHRHFVRVLAASCSPPLAAPALVLGLFHRSLPSLWISGRCRRMRRELCRLSCVTRASRVER